MERVIGKSTQDPEKSKFVYGNEKMNEEQNKNIEPIEITKAKDGLRPTRQLFSEPASSQNGKLVEFIIYCEKQALAEPTIQTKYKILRVMIRNNVNLADPEQVKLFIARNKNWSNGHKILAVYAYNEYAKMEQIHWSPPYYQNNETDKSTRIFTAVCLISI